MRAFIQQLALVCLLCLLPAGSGIAAQHALLIGISDYKSERIKDLQGPINDVTALESILVKHWDFDQNNIVSLVNADATEARIKQELARLHTHTNAGDDIVLYFSGHGTSVMDPDFGARLNLPDTSGAMVTHEFNPAAFVKSLAKTKQPGAANDGLLIGRYEIKPVLKSLSKDRTVFVVVDACFSGNAVRGKTSSQRSKQTRLLNLEHGFESNTVVRNGITGAARCINCDQHDKNALFDYENVIYFGAAAENQLAVDHTQSEIDAGLASTFDNKPHGGFSDALLRVLTDEKLLNDDRLSYQRLFNLLTATFYIQCAHCAHNPVLLPERDSKTLKQPFLSRMRSAPSKPDKETNPALQLAAVELPVDVMNELTTVRSVTLEATWPDIELQEIDNGIKATAADGRLISMLPLHWTPQNIANWAAARAWLKTRKIKDELQSQGDLKVSFRHPMVSPVAFEGETVSFNLRSDSEARLVMLIFNSHGGLSLLYPANASEAQHVLQPNRTQLFPDAREFQLQVSKPWGTDDVLVYALPADSTISEALLPLAQLTTFDQQHPSLQSFLSALDSGKTPYSASHVRFYSTE